MTQSAVVDPVPALSQLKSTVVNVRPVRIAALTFVIVAAVLQLSLGSPSTTFRLLNAAILVVAAVVLTMLLIGRGGRR